MKKTNEEVKVVAEAIAEKVSKVVKNSDKVAFLRPIIEEGKMTGKEIVEALKVKFPQMTEITIKTLVVDLKNPKYSVFKEETVVKGEDGKLRFGKVEVKEAA